MKQRTRILLLFGSLIVGFQFLLGEESAQLLSLRYYDHAGSSRLAIRLRGNPHYSTTRQDSELRIILPSTGVPASYDGAKMHFTSGFVTRVYIDREKGDSIVVTVGLKTNTAFRVEKMDKADGLFVDVFPDSSQTLVQGVVGTDSTRASGHPLVILPIQTMSFNTLVTAGSFSSKGNKDSIVPVSAPVAALSSTSFFLPETDSRRVFLSIALAVLGTALALLFIKRLLMAKSRRIASPFTAEFAAAISEQANRREDRQERPQPVVFPQNLLLDEDSSVRMLAKKYGRGLGEVKLSFDLRARQSERRWIAKVRELAENNDHKQDRVAVAKELGIGRGEVDLAVLLHHLKTPRTLKEEPV